MIFARPVWRLGLLAAVWGCVTGATVGDEAARSAAEASEHYEQERFDRALELYRAAQVERPDSPELHFNVGDALFKTGDLENALREFEQAAEANDPGLQSRSLYNQGNVHLQQQQVAEAVKAYQRALELDPADQDAKANLELALQLQEQEQQSSSGSDEKEQDQSEEKSQQQPQSQQGEQPPDQEQPQPDQAPEDGAEEQQPQPSPKPDGGQEEQREQQTPSPGESEMDAEEAQQLLDALRDREKEALMRRSGATESSRGKDW
jgi:Ca-activated chloride channel homolog